MLERRNDTPGQTQVCKFTTIYEMSTRVFIPGRQANVETRVSTIWLEMCHVSNTGEFLKVRLYIYPPPLEATKLFDQNVIGFDLKVKPPLGKPSSSGKMSKTDIKDAEIEEGMASFGSTKNATLRATPVVVAAKLASALPP